MVGRLIASSENHSLQSYIKAKIGAPKMYQYRNNSEKSRFDLFSAKGIPYKMVTTWATIGLSDAPSDLVVYGRPLGPEFLFVSNTVNSRAPDIISMCADIAINSNLKCMPGTIYPEIIDKYYRNTDVKHIMLHNPYLWSLDSQIFDSKVVAWLLLVPISNKEFELSRMKGVDYLNSELEKNDVNTSDLNRKSIF